jgi:hypothetical protein
MQEQDRDYNLTAHAAGAKFIVKLFITRIFGCGGREEGGMVTSFHLCKHRCVDLASLIILYCNEPDGAA